MMIVWPAMVRAPVRPSELVLAVMVQFTELPTTETTAQATFELAVGALQPAAAEAGFGGVIAMNLCELARIMHQL